MNERLEYQYGPTLKEQVAFPDREVGEWGPTLLEGEAENAVASIEGVEMMEEESEEDTEKMDASKDEDEGYESEIESEDEMDGPKDHDHDPKARGEWCREKGEHRMVLTRRY